LGNHTFSLCIWQILLRMNKKATTSSNERKKRVK
jgi:hypothetical protein